MWGDMQGWLGGATGKVQSRYIIGSCLVSFIQSTISHFWSYSYAMEALCDELRASSVFELEMCRLVTELDYIGRKWYHYIAMTSRDTNM